MCRRVVWYQFTAISTASISSMFMVEKHTNQAMRTRLHGVMGFSFHRRGNYGSG
jgi:hypothetical protein